MKIITFLFLCFVFNSVFAFDFSNFGSGNTVNEGSIFIDNNKVSGSSQSGIKGSGIITSRQYSLNPFTKIILNIVADVKVVASNKFRFKIHGDDNVIELITSTVNNKQLQIQSTKNYSTQNPISIVIEMPMLQEINQLGAGNIKLDNVTKETLNIILSGSGIVSARGNADKLTASITGSGSLHLQQLKTRNASITIEGVGSVFVNVAKHLNAKINGMGDIIYSGKPSVTRRIQGLGRIAHK